MRQLQERKKEQHTFRPSADHRLRFFEQGNALNRHRVQCPLHYTQGYSERRRGRQRRAPTGMY
jgi:hypothetical protein